MKAEFIELLKTTSDDQLILMVTKIKDKLTPEAVEAALNELKKRNLSSEQLESINVGKVEKEIEVAKQKSSKSSKSWGKVSLFAFPFLAYFIFRILQSSHNVDNVKLTYDINNNYVRQSNLVMDNLVHNSQVKGDENLARKVNTYGSAKLFIRNDNQNEQVIVYENPIPFVKKVTDIEGLFNNITSNISDDSQLSVTFLDQGQFLFNGKYQTYFKLILEEFSDGEKIFCNINVIEIKNKFYQIIIKTHDRENTLDKVFSKIGDKK